MDKFTTRAAEDLAPAASPDLAQGVGLRQVISVARHLACVIDPGQVPTMRRDGRGKLDRRFALGRGKSGGSAGAG